MTNTTYSQAVKKDLELWTGGNFNLKINKKFSTGIVEQFRFNDTISSLKQAFTQISLKYKINKSFSIRANYRYSARPNSFNRNRLSLDFNYAWNKKKFPLSLKYRFRFQDTKTNISGNKGTYIRNKFGVDYNLTKIVDPFTAFELFYRFNKKNEFRKYRFTLGLDWKLNKRMNIASYYRLQRDIGVKKPGLSNIFAILYSYKIKYKKLVGKS